MADKGNDEAIAGIDLDIVAASYQALVDAAGFDAMIEAWNRKLSLHAGDLTIGEHLFAQLERLHELALTGSPLPEDPIRRVVDTGNVATMVLTPDGQIAAINRSGEQLFGGVAGTRDSGGWLAATSRADLAALRASASGRGNRQRAVLRIACVSDSALADRRDDPVETPVELAAAELLPVAGADRPYIVVRQLDLPWSSAVGDILGESFGLTVAEIEVARLFHAHRDIPSVATGRGASLQTVRTQMKSILAKTETRTQANLLHLIATLSVRSEALRAGQSGWSNPFENETIIMRPSGARLAYSWTGAEGGWPILWVHGPGFNGIPPPSFLRAMTEAGARVFFLTRPGYGNSDRCADLSVEADHVAAILALAEHLDLKQCPAVGTTCSAQALHLARDQNPERIGLVVAISFSWKATEEEVDRLPVVHRTMFRLAAQAPRILRALCAVAIRVIRVQGPDWYVQRAHSYSDINRACLRDPENQALLRADCEMMLAHGVEGFLGDLQLAYADTGPALQRATAPTLWLMGNRDQHCDPVGTAELAGRLPRTTLVVIDDASELMLYQQPRAVAAKIIAAVRSYTQTGV